MIIDKITGKIAHWSARLLSYAGRVLVVISVLSSISFYWCSLFILPTKVIQEIEKIIYNFLWNGNENRKHAKVAWIDVCMPKKEGGLGNKSLKDWNKALMAKHL